MARLPFEAFLALRYLRPRRTFVSVITLISVLGVLLGVAVLIIVISVMSGFDQEWRNSILGFNAHLKVIPSHAILRDYEKVMKIVAANPSVVGVAPYIGGLVMAQTQPPSGVDPKFSAPLLLGVDPENIGAVSVLPKSITTGQFDLNNNGLVIGQKYAEGMDLQLGDRVTINSPSSLKKMYDTRGQTNAEGKFAQEFVVTGIFDVGFNEYNSSIIVTSLENAQELYNLGDGGVHGLQVMLRDPFQADKVASELRATLGDFTVRTWTQENRVLFDSLAMEKNMMFYLLFFIMIVAAFGIVNCQITFVVQKTREIGILKSLGASNQQVLWLFLSQSVVVGILGVGLGFGLAILALSYRNEFLGFMRHFNSNLLSPEIYQLFNLPASIQPKEILIICGTAFVTCVLAGLFPAWKASRLQPVEALRYE